MHPPSAYSRRTFLLGSLAGLTVGAELPATLTAATGGKTPATKPVPPLTHLSVLDNGKIRLGVDLDYGGTIGYLADARTRANVVNVHDLGRWIQPSYYCGPRPFGKSHRNWHNWSWNPIGAGDVYGHPSRLVCCHNDGKTIYVKSVPMQWALNGVPGDCVVESWIHLDGPAAHVSHRLTNRRADHRQYRAQSQELPAVYTIGKLYRLFSYDGLVPFTNGALRQIKGAQPPAWASWLATENWAALVDDHGWGLGVFHPGVYRFGGGFAGKPGHGGPSDDATGYIAPNRLEILDHNIVYEYQYVLILGRLADIRSYVYAHRPKDTRPDYRFAADRQHWHYVHATDTGWPIHKALHVLLEQDDPELVGPEQFWQAANVPRLYLRAAFHTRQTQAQLFWRVPGKDFAEERKVAFPIKSDGQFHTYTIDLGHAPAYHGVITGLRFDPVTSGTRGDYMEVAFLSFKEK